MQLSEVDQWRIWKLMSLVIKNGISLNEDFLKIILRPNITDSEIAKIYKSKFKITAPHHFLNLLASEEYKRILGNTEIEATDISEMKLAKLIDQHFEDLDEGIEFQQQDKIALRNKIIDNPEGNFNQNELAIQRNLNSMLESNEFAEWKNQRQKLLKNVERRGLCLLFEHRIKQRGIGNDIKNTFEKFQIIAQVLDENCDGVIDEEPWAKFKLKQSLINDFYDFLIDRKIGERDIQTLYEILRENSLTAEFKQSQIALAYLFSLIVVELSLNHKQKISLRNNIRVLTEKNVRLYPFLRRIIKQNNLNLSKEILKNILKTIQTNPFYQIDFGNRFRKQNMKFEQLKHRLQNELLQIQRIHQDSIKLSKSSSKRTEYQQTKLKIDLIEYDLIKIMLKAISLEEGDFETEEDRQRHKQEVLEDIEQLKLKIQKQNRSNQNIDRIFSEMSRNQNQIYQYIKKLRNIVLGFDTSQFCQLVRQNRSNKSDPNMNTILIVGPTGAGKSTLIQKIVGYNFSEKKLLDGTKQFVLKEKLKEQHMRLVSSNSTESETRCVTLYSIPKQSFFDQSKGNKYQVGDTPGLFDSGGPQIDAANSKGMLSMIKGLNSVIIVQMINGKDSGSRSKTLKQMAEVYAKLINLKQLKNERTKIPIIFIYNRINEDEVAQLRKSVEDILNNMDAVDKEGNRGVYFSFLLQDLRKKVTVFHPLSFDKKIFMNKIVNDSMSIPTQLFRYEFSEKTRLIIDKCLQNTLINFKNSFQSGNYLAAQYYFCVHERLVKEIEEPITKEFRTYLSSKILQIQKESKEKLEIITQYYATVKTFVAFSESTNRLNTFLLFQKHFQKDYQLLDIDEFIQKLLSQTSQKLLKRYDQHIECAQYDGISKNLSMQRLFSEYFSAFATLLTESLKKLKSIILQIQRTIKQRVHQNQFQGLKQNLEKCKHLINCFNKEKQASQQELVLEIINELSQKSQLDQLAGEKYLQAMRRDGQFSESFQKLKTILTQFNEEININEFFKQIVAPFYKVLKQKVQEYAFSLLQSNRTKFTSENQILNAKTIEQIKKDEAKAEKLKSIDCISHKLQDRYLDYKADMQRIAQKQFRLYEAFIGRGQQNFTRIDTLIKVLNNYKSFRKYLGTNETEEMEFEQILKDLLEQYFRNMKKTISKLKFSIKIQNHDQQIQTIITYRKSIRSITSRLQDQGLKEIAIQKGKQFEKMQKDLFQIPFVQMKKILKEIESIFLKIPQDLAFQLENFFVFCFAVEEQLKQYSERIHQLTSHIILFVKTCFSQLNGLKKKSQGTKKMPNIIFFHLQEQQVNNVFQLLQFLSSLEKYQISKQKIEVQQSNLFLEIEEIRKQIIRQKNLSIFNQYWNPIKATKNEAKLSELLNSLRYLKRLDQIDQNMSHDSSFQSLIQMDSMASKISDFSIIGRQSRKNHMQIFSFSMLFEIINQQYSTYIKEYFSIIIEKIVSNGILNMKLLAAQIQARKKLGNFQQSKQYVSILQKVIEYMRQQFEKISEMVNSTVDETNELEQIRQIMKKEIQQVFKYVKTFMQCEEIFKPDGIAALGKYRFSGLMATKYFEYYQNQFKNLFKSIDGSKNLAVKINNYIKIQQFLKLFNPKYPQSLQKILQYLKMQDFPLSQSPGKFLKQKNSEIERQLQNFANNEDQINFQDKQIKKYCKNLQKLSKQLYQIGQHKIKTAILKQNDKFRQKIKNGFPLKQIEAEIKRMYSDIPKFFSLAEERQLLKELKAEEENQSKQFEGKLSQIDILSKDDEFFQKLQHYQQTKYPEAILKIINLMKKRISQRISDIKRQNDVNFIKHFSRIWKISEQNFKLIKNQNSLLALYSQQEEKLFEYLVIKTEIIVRNLNKKIDEGILSNQQTELNSFQINYFFVLLENRKIFSNRSQQQFLRICRQFFNNLKQKCKTKITTIMKQDTETFLGQNTKDAIQIFIFSLKVMGNICRFFQQKTEEYEPQIKAGNISMLQFNEHIEIDRLFNNLIDKIKIFNDYLLNFEFYNDVIKSYGNQELQKIISKIPITIKSLQNILDPYNKLLKQIKNIGQIDINGIISSLVKKRKQFARKSKEQMQSLWDLANEGISNRYQIFLTQNEIIQKKGITCLNIQMDLQRQKKQSMQKKFVKMEKEFQTSFRYLKQIQDEEQKQIKLKKSDYDNIERVISKKSQELEAQVESSVSSLSDEKPQDIKRNKQQKRQNNYKVIQGQRRENLDKHNFQINRIRETFADKRQTELKNILHSMMTLEKLALAFKDSRIIQIKRGVNQKLMSWNTINEKKTIRQLKQQIDKSQHQSFALIAFDAYEVFKYVKAEQFNQVTSETNKIDYVLNNLRSASLNPALSNRIQEAHKFYTKQYQANISKYLDHPTEETIFEIANNIKKGGGQIVFIIARIFALWSILKRDKAEMTFPITPHTSQIVAILILVGAVQSDNNLKNQLVQVLTGQGKSIVLAGVCSYFAIKRYKVYCACYSEYLSKRDQQAFNQLFVLLGVNDKIKYGIFNKHCQEVLNSKPGETFRDTVREMIIKKEEPSFLNRITGFFKSIFDFGSSNTSEKKVLIIDEIDVFFDERFYGELYCPSISLNSKSIKNLIKLVWREVKKNKNLSSNTIIQTNEFKTSVSQYPQLQNFFENQIHGMISAAIDPNHSYYLQNNRIVYKVQDTVTHLVSFGYKTVFSYCSEFDSGRVSSEHYEQALKIQPIVAQFSYAQLPRYFNAIVGVSGTIQTMSNYQKTQLKSYKIDNTYFLPSIYGDNKVRLQNKENEYQIVANANFYQKLTDKIAKIRQTVVKNEIKTLTGRPILVILSTKNEMENFLQFQNFKTRFAADTLCLNEANDEWTRDMIIKRTCQRNRITLITKAFARGTDFINYDKEVEEIGGLYVILAYIPKSQSEFKQALGRTARQGKRGGFNVTVSDLQLQKMQLKAPESTVMLTLKKAWINRDEKMKIQIGSKMVQAKKQHSQLLKIVEDKALNQTKFVQNLCKLNEQQQVMSSKVKTIIGIDATGSMSAAISKLKEITRVVFERTFKIIQEGNVKAAFEIQIVSYRNYNVDAQQIRQCSGFHGNANTLISYFQNCKVGGGISRQAMQLLFQHANTISDLTQIIVIADIGSNTKKEMEHNRCTYRGEAYWAPFFPLSDSEVEIQQLKKKKIPIHSYYIGDKDYFERISKETNGECEQFNIYTFDAAEKLAKFIASKILNKIGGQRLVKLYQARYLG